MVEAGLSPLAALRAATSSGAAFLRADDRIGRIAPGFEADLLLLARNPLENIRNSRSIVTVIADGRRINACLSLAVLHEGSQITTIEGLSPDRTHPVQQAWLEIDVPQCGYCQSGQIMSAIGLLTDNPKPTDADIDTAMDGNVCRCGTYQRIRAAIHEAARSLA